MMSVDSNTVEMFPDAWPNAGGMFGGGGGGGFGDADDDAMPFYGSGGSGMGGGSRFGG